MTTTKKYKNARTGEIIEIRADFAQASSPLEVRYDGGDWVGTQYQVADARHRESEALRLVLALNENE